mmetsp:Transcript_36252/g.75400  ORF Transcript_36252/g.75400 Transcript_36252/m.75400 type:complete len:137 (-) Transcript_36252:361-771(-)
MAATEETGETMKPNPSLISRVRSDFSNPLQTQSLTTRMICFPCQCGWAFSQALCSADCDGAMSVIFCCPCRTFCGSFPTSSEQGHAALGLDEPETLPYQVPGEYEEMPEEGVEISYDLVFEMERKKRQVLSQAEIH